MEAPAEEREASQTALPPPLLLPLPPALPLGVSLLELEWLYSAALARISYSQVRAPDRVEPHPHLHPEGRIVALFAPEVFQKACQANGNNCLECDHMVRRAEVWLVKEGRV